MGREMVNMANNSISEGYLQIGNWVYEEFQPDKQNSGKEHGSHNWTPRYYVPYRIIDNLGEVAYKLKLPKEVQVLPTLQYQSSRSH